MVFGRKQQQEKDWKECMAEEDKEVLNSVLHMARKHKCAYMCADDSRVAQLWCAMLEMKRAMDALKAEQTKSQEVFKVISDMGEAEKRKSVEKIIRSMLKPTSERAPRRAAPATEEKPKAEPIPKAEQDQAIKNLVDSLLKF